MEDNTEIMKMNPGCINPIEAAAEEERKAKEHCKEVFVRYALPVRVGNWYEEESRFDAKIGIVEEKFRRGLAFQQKRECVLKYINEPVKLANFKNWLAYNAPVQIVTDQEYAIKGEEKRPAVKLAVSALVTEKQIYEDQPLYILPGSLITLSMDLKRLRRNVFCFVSCNSEASTAGSPVMYNDCVFIRLVTSGTVNPLYLRCETPDVDSFGLNKDRFIIRFSQTPDNYCKFLIQTSDNHMRLLQMNGEVQTFERILIRHVLTHRLLAVDKNLINHSLIVGKEILACCFNYKDIYNQITSENYWVIRTREVTEEDEECQC